MLVTFIALIGVIPVDQVVTAKGIVVSRAATIVVQPLETSIIRSIDVYEGQRVRAGDLLARLDPTFTAADVASLAAQVTAYEAQSARLTAEATGKPFAYSGADPVWLLQDAIHARRIAEFNSKMDSFRNREEELSSQIARAKADATAYNDRLSFAQSIEDMRKQLEKLQIASKLQLLTAQDVKTEMARALAGAQQIGEGAKRSLAALQSERDAYLHGWRGDVSEKLADVNQKLSDAREQLNKAELRRKLVELRSDTDAIVHSMAKVSVGSVLQSGQQLITLVPAGARLEVEANIFGRDSGFVKTGDQVAVKFDTFPFTQYGMADGTVEIVSPTSFTSQDDARHPTNALPVTSPEPDPFYRARIRIDRVSLHDVPRDFEVTPGMPVTADIKVGKRTVLTYMIGRIAPILHEGMREP